MAIIDSLAAARRLPVNIGSTHELGCASTREAVARAMVSAMWVNMPEHDNDPRVVMSASVPGPESNAKVWVRTSAPAFTAVRENGEWVATVGQGSLVMIGDKDESATVSSRALRELDTKEKEDKGLKGRWGVVQFPTLEGVRYR